MDAVVLALSILAGAFWPVALLGLVLDAALWGRPAWDRARRVWWFVAFGLAVATVVLTAGAFARQIADGFYMAVTWTPIAAIVLAWMILGSWRRATRPLPQREPAEA